MAYPSPTTINASAGLGDFLTYINTVTSNWASNMILIGIYVIFLMGYYRVKDDVFGGMAVAGFSTFVVAMLLWIGGFVTGVAFAFSIAVMMLGVAVILINKRN